MPREHIFEIQNKINFLIEWQHGAQKLAPFSEYVDIPRKTLSDCINLERISRPNQEKIADACGFFLDWEEWKDPNAVEKTEPENRLDSAQAFIARFIEEKRSGGPAQSGSIADEGRHADDEVAPAPPPILQIKHSQIEPTPNFIGRDDSLKAIETALWSHDKSKLPPTTVLYGLGGTGKTTLAKEYASKAANRYQGIWWLDAENEDNLDEGLVQLGKMFIPDLHKSRDKRNAAQETLRYLANHYDSQSSPWLLIYDNVESIEKFRRISPKGGAHAILTSRTKRWSADVSTIAVTSLAPNAAAEYVKQESGREDITQELAHELADAVGHLPLALSHTAAFLRDNDAILPEDYLKNYNHWLAQCPADSEYPASVYATFQAAFHKCERAVRGSSSVLLLASMLGPDHIPLELFQQDRGLYPHNIVPVELDEMFLTNALGVLNRHSLIHLDMKKKSFSMHRLVQAAAKSNIDDTQHALTEMLINVLASAYPDNSKRDFREWSTFERLQIHSKTVLEEASDDIGEPLFKVLDSLAFYLNARGFYAEAEPVYKRALSVAENLDDGSAISNVRYGLGVLYDNLESYEEAEEQYLESLAIREQVYDGNSPYIASTLNNLALIYQEQEKYDEAEDLLMRALHIRQDYYGETHPRIAQSLNNIGSLYRAKGLYDLAEEYSTQSLAMREQELPDDHPEIANTVSNLGKIYFMKGELAESEAFHRRALDIREKALGPDHLYLALNLKFLGDICCQTDRKEEAGTHYHRALKICEDSNLHKDHPRVKELLEVMKRCGYSEPV